MRGSNGEARTDDENPSPAMVASHAVHLPNGAGEQTTEATGEGRR